MPREYTPLAERFPVHTDTAGPLPAHRPQLGNCWLWTAYIAASGYGVVRAFGRPFPAHRAGWILASGAPIPEGLIVCHTCDVRHCVRNDDAGVYELNGVLLPRFGHLWLGTYADNLTDMWNKGRRVPKRHWEPIDVTGDNHWSRQTPELIVRGERNGNAVLTTADVIAIRALRQSGMRLDALAERFKVSRATVYQVVSGKTWRHL